MRSFASICQLLPVFCIIPLLTTPTLVVELTSNGTRLDVPATALATVLVAQTHQPQRLRPMSSRGSTNGSIHRPQRLSDQRPPQRRSLWERPGDLLGFIVAVVACVLAGAGLLAFSLMNREVED
ncbi:MAG: hypothetical protein AAF456_15100 [Planctomycetota bacterium]